MNNKIKIVLLICIFTLACILRFYKLGEIPYGFYQDESAIGYNAYSIMETGKDEHGKTFPLYFKSFGDYKLPVYIYSTIIPIKIFGLNEFAVRFPSAFFGFLTVIVFYFFTKEVTKDDRLSVLSTFLLSINPWHIHYSRATFEVSICLFLFVFGSLLIYKAINYKKKGYYLLATVCFVLSLYTYNLTRLLSPLLYVAIIAIHKKQLKEVNKKELFITYIVSFLILIPFILTLLESGGISSANGTLIFSSASVQSSIIETRSYLLVLPAIISKVFFNNFLLTCWQYINNVVNYFSVNFFFVSGPLHGNHGIGNVGLFYLFEFPLILLGFYKLINNKIKWGRDLLIWLIITILIASLTRDIPHATRSFFLIVPLEILSAFGFLMVWNKIKKINQLSKTMISLFVVLFVSYNFIFYITSYYIRFPVLYAKAWRAEDKSLSNFINQNKDKYDKIIFDNNAGFIYTSLIFYAAYNPKEFQESAVWQPDDSEGFSKPVSFGKFEFKDNIDWDKDYKSKRTLIVTTSDRKPENISSLMTFYYPKRPVVIATRQEIIQYPVDEIAYVLVETK